MKKAALSVWALAMTLLVFSGCTNPTLDRSGSNADVKRDAHGVTVTLRDDVVKYVRLQVYADDIVRVTATPHANFDNLPDYLMVVAEPKKSAFEVTETAESVELKTAKMRARINLASGAVTFFDASGEPLLTEAERKFSDVIDEPAQRRGGSLTHYRTPVQGTT